MSSLQNNKILKKILKSIFVSMASIVLSIFYLSLKLLVYSDVECNVFA